MDLLESSDPTTAGQLADLTVLTTGAITGMLNRLEEARLVRRERDPNDGRRVIVRLERGTDEIHKIGPIFDSLGKAWDELASDYDHDQIAFFLEFLKRSNAMSRKEFIRLQEAPSSEGNLLRSALRSEEWPTRCPLRNLPADLAYRRGDGRALPGSLRGTDAECRGQRRGGHYPLSTTSVGSGWAAACGGGHAQRRHPWQIVIQGGASDVTAELGGLDLAGLEVKGGLSSIRLELPMPSGVVPIRISG